MMHLWMSMRSYGASHGVDPLIFAALYMARLPFLLATLAIFTRHVRQHRPAAGLAILFLALGLFPYTYILVFGRGLPGWLTAIMVAAAAGVLAQGIRKLRAILRTNAEPIPEGPSPGQVSCSAR